MESGPKYDYNFDDSVKVIKPMYLLFLKINTFV